MGSKRINLLGISGSLRSQSSNSRLLAASSDLIPEQATLQISDCLDQLPYFNPDLDLDAFEATQKWTDQVRQCDGIVVSTPEYARGYPGVLKNALDWLVQSDAFIEKPFMFLHASNRSSVAKDTLTTVLETMSGIHVMDASLTIHLVGSSLSTSEITQEFKSEITAGLKSFVHTIERKN